MKVTVAEVRNPQIALKLQNNGDGTVRLVAELPDGSIQRLGIFSHKPASTGEWLVLEPEGKGPLQYDTAWDVKV